MEVLKNSARHAREDHFRLEFIRSISSVAGAQIGMLGIFDCTTGTFLKHWAYKSEHGDAPSVSDALQTIADAIQREGLDTHVRGDAAQGTIAAAVVEVDGLLVHLGKTNCKLAVAALGTYGKVPSGAACPRKLVEVAGLYAAQQVTEIFAEQAIAREQAIDFVLNQVTTGFAVIDAQGRVLYMSPQSNRTMRRFGGLKLVDDTVRTVQSERQAALSAAIMSVAKGQRGPTLVQISETGERPMVVLVTRAIRVPTAGQALIIFGSVKQDPQWQDQLLKCLGFTPAECRVATRLLDGMTIRETAEAINLKESTVRDYLKRIFAKANVRRQSEFLSLCYSLLPPVDSGVDATRTAAVTQGSGRISAALGNAAANLHR